MNFTYKEVKDKLVKRRLLTNWQKENTTDVLEIKSSANNLIIELILENNNCIGWLGRGMMDNINVLSFVFINKDNRGKGYLKAVINNAHKDLGIEYLLAGKYHEKLKEFEPMYHAGGFIHFFKMIEIATGNCVAEFYANEEIKACYPVGSCIMISLEEMLEMNPSALPGTIQQISFMDAIMLKKRKLDKLTANGTI